MLVKNSKTGEKRLVFAPGEVEFLLCRSRKEEPKSARAVKYSLMSINERIFASRLVAEMKPNLSKETKAFVANLTTALKGKKER